MFNYRYLSLNEIQCNYCAMHPVSVLITPFVKLKCQRKMAARYFLMVTDQRKKSHWEHAVLDRCSMTELSMEIVLKH